MHVIILTQTQPFNPATDDQILSGFSVTSLEIINYTLLTVSVFTD